MNECAVSSLTAGKSKQTGTPLPAVMTDNSLNTLTWFRLRQQQQWYRQRNRVRKEADHCLRPPSWRKHPPIEHQLTTTHLSQERQKHWNDEELNELLNGTNGAFATDARNSRSNLNLEGVFQRPAVVLVCFITQEKNSEHKQKTSYLHSHTTEREAHLSIINEAKQTRVQHRPQIWVEGK